MTKNELAMMGIEFKENYYTKYNLPVEVQYKYRGEIRTRTEYRWTEEARRIHSLLDIPAFTCPCCGQLVSFNELEFWRGDSLDDLLNDEIPCSECYEDEMGEDL